MDILMGTAAAILISFTLIFFVVTSFVDTRRTKQKLRERLRQSWGKQPETKYKHEDLEAIASYFLNHTKKNTSRFFIDDITCRDLDMDDLFIRLNSTETTAGEETLYRLLREPSFNLEILKARRNLIEFFQTNQAERVAIQISLAKLGKRRLIRVTDYFFGAVSPRSGN